MSLENDASGTPRRGVAADWASDNPVLPSGAKGFETDTGLHKVGNGVDAFADLDYVPDTAALNHLLNES